MVAVMAQLGETPKVTEDFGFQQRFEVRAGRRDSPAGRERFPRKGPQDDDGVGKSRHRATGNCSEVSYIWEGADRRMKNTHANRGPKMVRVAASLGLLSVGKGAYVGICTNVN